MRTAKLTSSHKTYTLEFVLFGVSMNYDIEKIHLLRNALGIEGFV